MSTEPETVRRDWRIPDALWERLQPLLPARKPHPLGGHRPRGDDRKAMDAIFGIVPEYLFFEELELTIKRR